MRVLFMLDDLGHGGAERVTLNLLQRVTPEVTKRGGEVGLFVSGAGSSLSGLVPPNVKVWQANETRRLRSSLFSLRKAYASVSFGYDLVIPTSPHTLALTIAGGKPVLPWVHFSWEGFKPYLSGMLKAEVAMLYPIQRRMVQVSPSSISAMPALFGKKGWSWIPNMFDPLLYKGVFQHQALFDRLRGGGNPILGYIGRLAPEKGVERLLEVHRRLLGEGSKHWLVVAGEGPMRPALEQEQGVFLLGEIENPLPFMEQLDALLLTSYHEAWPTVITEAIWANTPVIAYDCPTGPRDMLTGGLSTGLVQDGDVTAFAAAVATVLNSPDTALSSQDRLAFLDRADPERVVANWVSLIFGDCH